MRIITLVLIAVLSVGLNAQTTQKLTASKVNEYGLIYTLPNTVFDITIEVEREVKTPGEYYRYAKKYLNVENPISEKSEIWRMKSITLHQRGVKGDSTEYIMQFKKGTSPYLFVNEQNAPLSINAEPLTVDSVVRPINKPLSLSPLDSDAAMQVITQEMLQSQSIAKRAELAASQIYALRQSRTEIITGQAEQMPPDGDAMKIVLDNINAQEEALTAMFVGATQVATDIKTITFKPEDNCKNKVLARLSIVEGLVAENDLSGAPIYISVEITKQGELPKNEAGLIKQFPKGGVAYRIPGQAKVTISYDDKEYYSNILNVAQFGIIFGIDPSIFTDKKAPSYMHFDSVTGAIVEIGAVTNNQ